MFWLLNRPRKIEIPLIEELNILRSLEKADASPLKIVPVSSPLLKPVNLFQSKYFGKHLMIRAANMKLTIDKESEDWLFWRMKRPRIHFIQEVLFCMKKIGYRS